MELNCVNKENFNVPDKCLDKRLQLTPVCNCEIWKWFLNCEVVKKKKRGRRLLYFYRGHSWFTFRIIHPSCSIKQLHTLSTRLNFIFWCFSKRFPAHADMAERQSQESYIIKRMKNIKTTQGGINSTVTKKSPLDEQQEESHGKLIWLIPKWSCAGFVLNWKITVTVYTFTRK